jgi:hypothetical protein
VQMKASYYNLESTVLTCPYARSVAQSCLSLGVNETVESERSPHRTGFAPSCHYLDQLYLIAAEVNYVVIVSQPVSC